VPRLVGVSSDPGAATFDRLRLRGQE
jgi:hypothetical protein